VQRAIFEVAGLQMQASSAAVFSAHFSSRLSVENLGASSRRSWWSSP